MARTGRFGRASSGSANLSSFISNLVQQSESMNERALINAFQDQTVYGGSVPNATDIADYVASKTAGMDQNSAEYSYYMNMLETAQRAGRARDVQAVTTGFNSSMGDNFGEFYDQISSLLNSGDLSESERQEYSALLASKTGEYVEIVAGQYKNGSVTYEELLSKTDAAIGLMEGTSQENAIVMRAGAILEREATSLNSGNLTVDEYKSRVQASFAGIDPESPTAWDIKNAMFTTVWNREISAQASKVSNSLDKSTGTQINKTKAYIDWAKSKLEELTAAGITGGSLYDEVKKSIGSYKNNLSELQVRAGNELYVSRKANTDASRNILDLYAQQAAVYVTGAAATKLRELTGGVTLNDLLAADPFAMVRYFDLNPSAQADFDAALTNYRDNAKELVATARSIGAGTGEAAALRKDSTEIARYTGQDTTLEDYEDAFDVKLALIGKAQGDDSVIEKINAEWLKFLNGTSTPTFGKGIASTSSQLFAGLIGNERAVYEVGGAGGAIGAIGATLLDYILPSQATGDNDTRTNSQIESENVAKTTQMSSLLQQGKAVRFIDANGIGSTIGLRQADQGIGEFTFAERNANGTVRATIRQGVPVVGTSRGAALKGGTWGFYYPDTKVWVEAATGKTYLKPPIAMRNGGAPEFDENGNPTRVTFEVDPRAVAKDGISIDATFNGTGLINSALYKPDPKQVTEVSPGVAIVGAQSWRNADAGSVINKATLDAIAYSYEGDAKTDVENQIAIYNERAGRFDVGYGESRLTGEKPSGSVVITPTQAASTFDKFLGSGSTMPGGTPRSTTIAVKGADSKISWSKINFADAYTQTSPGVFVRKDSATAYAINGSGAAASEANQFFPKIIDVSKSTNSPSIKPYVDSGFIKTTIAGGVDPATSAQNYFFRNSVVNKDITSAGAAPLTAISPKISSATSQAAIDFRAGERDISNPIPVTPAPGITLGSPTLLSGIAPGLAPRVTPGVSLGSPTLLSGIKPITASVPMITVGKGGGGV